MNSLFRNSVFNFLSQAIIFMSAFLLSIFLARMLGPSQMGEYSYWMWLIGTGALVFTLGIPKSLMRFVSQYKSKSQSIAIQIISRTLIYQNKLLFLFLATAVIFILIAGGEHKITYSIIACSLFVFVLNNILASILSGLQKYNFLLKVNLIVSPVSFILTLVVLFFFKDLNNLLAVNLLISLVSLGISAYYLKDYFKFGTKPIPGKIYSEIKGYTLSISLIVFLDLILMERSEIFFLKNFSTNEQIAFYSIGFGLVGRVMTLMPGAVSGVIMPKIAWLYGKSDSESIKQTYFSSTRYLIFLTLPIIFAGISLVDLPVQIFYGFEYLTLVPVIQILLVSGGLSAMVAAAAAVLYGTGGQKFILKLAAIAAVVNIILDVILIPGWGAIGAAFANSLAQLLGAIIGTYYMVKVKKMPFPRSESLKMMVASGGAFIFIYFAEQLLIGTGLLIMLLILSVSFIILYLSGLYFLRFFIKQDYDLLSRTINKLPFLQKI